VASDANHLYTLVIIGQHLFSVKVKLSPWVRLFKMKIVTDNFSRFDFFAFYYALFSASSVLFIGESGSAGFQ